MDELYETASQVSGARTAPSQRQNREGRLRISYRACLKHHGLLVEHHQALTEHSDLVWTLYQDFLISLESGQDPEQIRQEYHQAVHKQVRLIQIHGQLVREHLHLVQDYL